MEGFLEPKTPKRAIRWSWTLRRAFFRATLRFARCVCFPPSLRRTRRRGCSWASEGPDTLRQKALSMRVIGTL